MSKKKSNIAIWKIKKEGSESPNDSLERLLNSYRGKSSSSDLRVRLRFPELKEIPTTYIPTSGYVIKIYTRTRHGSSLGGFLSGHITDDEQNKLINKSVDICLFVLTENSLYVVTAMGGYHIIADFVDPEFPFEVASRIMSNLLKVTETRNLTGESANTSEIFKKERYISSAESFDKVWKRAVGRINIDSLPEGYLREVLNPDKPASIELKSSFTLKKSLDLESTVKIIQDLEDNILSQNLSDEQRRSLQFLSGLQIVRQKNIKDTLKNNLIESIKKRLEDESFSFDFYVADPNDIEKYYSGSNFKINSQCVNSDFDPTIEDIMETLNRVVSDLDDDDKKRKIENAKFKYLDSDDVEQAVRLIDMFHGQISLDGRTYFLLDKNWYVVNSDFLDILKKDFIKEVFDLGEDKMLFDKSVPVINPWTSGNEDTYNKNLARLDGYYLGDKIFLKNGNKGKVELFDVLFIDESSRKVYIMHVKNGFDSRMRDACSQIRLAMDIIERDANFNFSNMKRYYDEWKDHEINRGVSEQEFIKWFQDYERFYLVVCSVDDFSKSKIESNSLASHVARYEVLSTRYYFNGRGKKIYIANARKANQ